MRNLEKGQHIFIAFQDGKAVLDSQLRPRMYTSLKNADRWTPTVNKGKIEYVEYAPTHTPPNEWVSVEDAMPPEHEPVLCIVDGKPKPNITLEDAYQIGSWNKADGWIIDEYLDWEDADVSWWMSLPAPPDKDNNVPAKTPNEPLTQADIDKMHFDRVWIDYGVDDSGERCGEEGVVLYGKLYDIDTLEGAGLEEMLLDTGAGETLDRPSGDYKVYRRPPGEAE